MSNGNDEFKGSTKARLNSIEHQLDTIQADVKSINKKLNTVITKTAIFSGSLGVASGLVTSWIFEKLT